MGTAHLVVMWRTVLLASLASCWSEDLVDDTFTQDQWAYLQANFTLPDFEPKASAASVFGQKLFFETDLAGPITIVDPDAPPAGTLSCKTCHDPMNLFVDPRAKANNISIGAGYTAHNALSLVNVGYKALLLEQRGCTSDSVDPECRAFSWNGRYENAGAVLELAGLGKPAMNSTKGQIAGVIRAKYRTDYIDAFGRDPVAEPDDAEIFAKTGLAFEAYVRNLKSVDAPFDQYIGGDPSALTAAQRRGLAVFIGKGFCVECHSGPLLSDLKFHNTGVPQVGPHVPPADRGLAATFDDPANVGKFLTQPLRNVSLTAPYMHAGQFATLRDVIEFYDGGGALGDGWFSGERDPRIQPLGLTEAEKDDLEAFLGSLVGTPIQPPLMGMP